MAIESAAFLRRSARTEYVAALVVLLVIGLCGLAAAQAPTVPTVVSGSVIPVAHGNIGPNSDGLTGQIYRIVFASTGDMLFLDTSEGGLYQLKPDGKTFVTVSAPNTVLNNKFHNAGLAIDSNDTIYITDRWSGYVMYRVPYNATSGTWSLSASSADWIKPADLKASAEIVIDPIDGTLIFSRENPDISIIRLVVNPDGTPGTVTPIITGLAKRAAKMAVDSQGNIYFIEEPWIPASNRARGVFRMPKATSGLVGDGSGSIEATLDRADPIPDIGDFNGVAVDRNDNLYLTQQINLQWNQTYNAIVMIPNTGGTLDREHAKMIAPISPSAQLTIDPKGYFWVSTNNGATGWDGIPGTNSFTKWAMGSAEVPSAPVGDTGTNVVRVYYSFNGDATPARFEFSELGGGSDFVTVPTDPVSTMECVPGTTYHQWDGCYVQVALKARVPGDVSGQLLMRDGSNNVLATTNLHGVGLASGLAVLVPAAESQIGSSLSGQKQLATDAQGNVYVADSLAGRVYKYVPGVDTPVSIGTSLLTPTGVTVDGNGNVYIADSGRIYKVPFNRQSGTYGTQSSIQTGLGTTNVKLAADGAGNVYAADPANNRVIKVFNSLTNIIMSGRTAVVVLSGVTPSALAADAAGNLVVADSGTSTLLMLPVRGGKVPIANGFASVSGLAVDASGSVYVSQADGVRRIPSVPGNAITPTVGGYSTNDTVQLAPNSVTSPSGVAVDPAGNVFASQDLSITKLSFNGAVNFNDFGPVMPNLQTTAEFRLFNFGNVPLIFTDFAQDLITDPEQFETLGADDSPNCDSNPDNPMAAGASCWLGVGLTPNADGVRTATLTIGSNAANNAAPVTVALSGNAIADTRPATRITITTSPAQPVYPATVTVTVTVSRVDGAATPVGEVALAVSGQPKFTLPLDANGVATHTYENLNGGTYKVRASYGGFTGSGDPDSFGASGGAGQFVVNQAPSSSSVAATFNFVGNHPGENFVKLGSNFVLTVTVTSAVGTPTGKVRFVEGADQHLADPLQPFATLDANGQVTFNTHNLDSGGIPPGTASTHVITAVYDGDTNFASSSATPLTIQIINPGLYVDTTGTSFSITPGQPATAIIHLRPLEGYTSTVDLLCVNVPQYSECTFDNPHVDLSTNPFVKTIEVTISTNVPVNAGAGSAANRSGSPWLFASMFGIGLVGLIVGKKTKYSGRVLMMICVILLITGAVAGLSACANAGYTKTPDAPHVVTPSGAYNVTIIALDMNTRANVAVANTFPVTVK